jgi:HK97 family phage prohead protease
VRRPKSAEPQQPAQPVRRAPLLVRSFEAASVAVDGRTLEVLIVPWDRPARVADAPDYVAYQESWVGGAFEDQLGSRGKVLVNVEHEAGIRGVVGHGVELRDESDGLHGTFELHRNIDADKTLELIRARVLDGISLEAIALLSVRQGGVVKRVKAKLKGHRLVPVSCVR